MTNDPVAGRLSKHLSIGFGKLVSWLAVARLIVAHSSLAAEPSWLDISGREVDPFATNGDKALVFIFVKTDCPISNRYAPEVHRLCEKFSRQGVSFWLVHADPDTPVEVARQHAQDYRYACGVLRDPKHLLVKLCEARVTPEAAVFTPQRRLVYHGRIDDRFVALGQERATATRHDLEEVLGAVLNGKAVAPASTKAVGCTIAPLP